MVWDELRSPGGQCPPSPAASAARHGRLYRRHQGRPRVPARFAGRVARARPGTWNAMELGSAHQASTASDNVVFAPRGGRERASEEREQLLGSWSRARAQGRGQEPEPIRSFVDLGGIDGLLHITDMAWKRGAIRRSRGSRPDSTCACSSTTRSATASAWPHADGRGSVGQHRPSAIRPTHPVRQGQQRHRLRRVRGDRARRRRPGPRVGNGLDHKNVILQRSCRSATRWRSWCWTGRRASRSRWHQAVTSNPWILRGHPQEGRQGRRPIKSITDFGISSAGRGIGPDPPVGHQLELHREDIARTFKKAHA